MSEAKHNSENWFRDIAFRDIVCGDDETDTNGVTWRNTVINRLRTLFKYWSGLWEGDAVNIEYRTYKAVVRLSVTYGGECWPLK